MKDAIHSSETSILTRDTGHHIPEDGILHSHCRENLKSYTEIYLTNRYNGIVKEKRQLERIRRRWEDNVTVRKDVVSVSMDWILLDVSRVQWLK
jgi:hypothetical protein